MQFHHMDIAACCPQVPLAPSIVLEIGHHRLRNNPGDFLFKNAELLQGLRVNLTPEEL